MLHHAAHHLAAMNGQHESLQIIDFKQRSLKAINNSLRERQKADDDGIVIGVGLLANAEVRDPLLVLGRSTEHCSASGATKKQLGCTGQL